MFPRNIMHYTNYKVIKNKSDRKNNILNEILMLKLKGRINPN
jgi:hypothetical protein